MICRILPHATASGPANMALDEALLEAVSADPSAAAFRTYEWSEPTLSLGYFQRRAEADPHWRGVPLVRRPTGGGAIWHDQEITYALVLPRSHPLGCRAEDLYRAVHAAIAGVIAAATGVPAARRGEADAAPPRNRPFLCFTDSDPEAIVIGQHKVVGSAQRRRPGAVLQHGSVLLARSSRTPELPGIGDLIGSETAGGPWSIRLASQIPVALGLTPLPQDTDRAERRRAADLERDVYRNPSWTGKR